MLKRSVNIIWSSQNQLMILDTEKLVGCQRQFKAVFARTHKSYYIPTITTKRGRLLAKHSLCIQIIKADQTFGRTISFCLQSFLSKKSGERAPGRAAGAGRPFDVTDIKRRRRWFN